ncbi:hypothetical protein ER13_04710 [Brevundimonas sp. EAKA]|nr:hypothetical protein ER13_04710 [Brevundimonas sp. EAKA]
MTLTLDRIASPVGEVLVATDAEGAVRALDFHDYEDLRPAGDWIDAGEDAPSDRLATVDTALAARAEAWRPWRAYGALYWNRVTETADA